MLGVKLGKMVNTWIMGINELTRRGQEVKFLEFPLESLIGVEVSGTPGRIEQILV